MYCKSTGIAARLLVAWILIAGLADQKPVFSQSIGSWSVPERIPGLANDTVTPVLLADEAGYVHALASQWFIEEGKTPVQAIIYSRFTPNQGWTAPIDIILSPLKEEARLLDAYLDAKGSIHVIFFGGDGTLANVYHTMAPSDVANRATAWTSPQLIDKALDPASGTIVGDGSGNMIALFAGTSFGAGIYESRSTNYGMDWSAALPIFLTYDGTLSPFEIDSFLDSAGSLHLVWSIYNELGLAEEVLYASLADLGGSWPAAQVLEVLGGAPAASPNITEANGELILIHHAGTSTGEISRFMRRSPDRGASWTAKERLFPHIGSNGPPTFVVDNEGVVNLFFANRVGSTHGIWQSKWQDASWSTPDPIQSGPKTANFDPMVPDAVATEDFILVTWMTDAGARKAEFGGTFYSLFATAPVGSELSPDGRATAAARATQDSEPAPTTTPEVTAAPATEDDQIAAGGNFAGQPAAGITGSTSPIKPVLIGIIPVVALLLFFVVLQTRRRIIR